MVRALIDTGCSWSIVASWVARAHGGGGTILAVEGGVLQAIGEAEVEGEIDSAVVNLTCLVVKKIVKGIDVILGMDFIQRVGGVTVLEDRVWFGMAWMMGAEAHGSVATQPLCGLSISEKVWFGGIRVLEPRAGVSAVGVSGGSLQISDPDFTAVFDGSSWMVWWHWKGDYPSKLKNTIASY